MTWLAGCFAYGQNPEQHLVAGYKLNGNAKEISQSALRGKPNGIKPATDRFGQAGQATQFTEAGYAIRGYITLPVQISPENYLKSAFVSGLRQMKPTRKHRLCAAATIKRGHFNHIQQRNTALGSFSRKRWRNWRPCSPKRSMDFYSHRLWSPESTGQINREQWGFRWQSTHAKERS